MWTDFTMTARQWGNFYWDNISGFLTRATPETYTFLLCGALVLAIMFMKMNFGR